MQILNSKLMYVLRRDLTACVDVCSTYKKSLSSLYAEDVDKEETLVDWLEYSRGSYWLCIRITDRGGKLKRRRDPILGSIPCLNSFLFPISSFSPLMTIRELRTQRSFSHGVSSGAATPPTSTPSWKNVFKFGKDGSKKFGQPVQGGALAAPSVYINGADDEDEPYSPTGAGLSSERGIEPLRNDPIINHSTESAADIASAPTAVHAYDLEIAPTPLALPDEHYSDNSESPTDSSDSTSSPPLINMALVTPQTPPSRTPSRSGAHPPSPLIIKGSSSPSLSRRFFGASSRSPSSASTSSATVAGSTTPTQPVSPQPLSPTSETSSHKFTVNEASASSSSLSNPPMTAPAGHSAFAPIRSVSGSVLTLSAKDRSSSRTHLKDLTKSPPPSIITTTDSATPNSNSNSSPKPSPSPQATIKKPNAATRFIRRVASAPNAKNLFNVPGNRTAAPTFPSSSSSGPLDSPAIPTSPTTRNGLLAPAPSFSSLLNARKSSRSKSRTRNGRRGTTTSEEDSLDVELGMNGGTTASASSSRRPSSTQGSMSSGTMVGFGVGGRKVRANSVVPSSVSGKFSPSGTMSDGGLQVPKSPEEQRARFRRTYSSNSIKVSSVRSFFSDVMIVVQGIVSNFRQTA